MYQPEKKSKILFYFLFIFVVAVGWVIYAFTRPLAVESACSEISQKTTDLTNSFNYDPLSDYSQSKAKCMEEVLSAQK